MLASGNAMNIILQWSNRPKASFVVFYLSSIQYYDLSLSCRRLLVSFWKHWGRQNHSSSDASVLMLRRCKWNAIVHPIQVDLDFKSINLFLFHIDSRCCFELFIYAQNLWYVIYFFFLMFRRKCVLMKHSLCSSCGTQACWKQCASDGQVMEPSTPFR